MKRTIGLDLGSRRTKAVVLEDFKIVEQIFFEAWSLDSNNVVYWVKQAKTKDIGATGYFRALAGREFLAKVNTEIIAFSKCAGFLCPSARTLIDIGGQDAKVIRLGENGRALDFEMNDRCAAGTGKFFEIAAKILGFPLVQMPFYALDCSEVSPVSSTCAVFAESEIISRLADGVKPAALARGVFRSVAERLEAMLRRVNFCEPVIMVGGGANPCLSREISDLISLPVELPSNGVFFGAIGAALLAGKE